MTRDCAAGKAWRQVLWTRGANSELEWKVVTQLASNLGLVLEPYEARTSQDLDQGIGRG